MGSPQEAGRRDGIVSNDAVTLSRSRRRVNRGIASGFPFFGTSIMRAFGFRSNVTTNLRAPPIPDARFALPRSTYHRRLDDAMVAIFERACTGNNLDAAAEVLTVLETWHERRSARYGSERRIDDRHLVAMRAALERLRVLRTV